MEGKKKRGRGKEGIWWLTVYLIDRGEGGHVNAVNVMNGDGRQRRGGEVWPLLDKSLKNNFYILIQFLDIIFLLKFKLPIQTSMLKTIWLMPRQAKEYRRPKFIISNI